LNVPALLLQQLLTSACVSVIINPLYKVLDSIMKSVTLLGFLALALYGGSCQPTGSGIRCVMMKQDRSMQFALNLSQTW
jgi:hypothetical protein